MCPSGCCVVDIGNVPSTQPSRLRPSISSRKQGKGSAQLYHAMLPMLVSRIRKGAALGKFRSNAQNPKVKDSADKSPGKYNHDK